MTTSQVLSHLSVPTSPVDVVLDTDAYNEIDDQFAIAYLLATKHKTEAIYAAPFHNRKSTSAADGMEKSYREILHLLGLCNKEVPVYRGSTTYLPNETTPVLSDAAKDLCARAMAHTPEHPLYVIAIGAITNVASAILLEPAICDRIVVVWLGGHARHFHDTREFNMMQDIAAARVVMGAPIPFVQLPCLGVVSSFTLSGAELAFWFKGKNKICDYLAENTTREAESYAKGMPWTRVIWDVTAVAWLENHDSRLMLSRKEPVFLPSYDNKYCLAPNASVMEYVYHINRDVLLRDLLEKLNRL